MTTIGHFKKAGSEYVGEISTLNFQMKNIRIVPETTRLNDAAPSHRLFLGKYEIGAGWIHRSGENRNYLSIKLDDPALAAPIYASLFDNQDGETSSLVWSRNRKMSGE